MRLHESAMAGACAGPTTADFKSGSGGTDNGSRAPVMHAYVILLIFSAVFTATLTGALLSFKSRQREGLLAASLLGCGVVWSLVQALWSSADDAETAIALVRFSAVGWVPIPVIALHLVLISIPQARPRLHRMIPWAYAVTAAIVLLDWLTPLVHSHAVQTSWGYAYEFGPAFPIVYAWIFVAACTAIWLGLTDLRSSPVAAERGQSSVLAIALLVPLVVASVTDGLLPMLSIHAPYLGGVSIAWVGIVGAVSAWRYGYSPLVPTAFNSEILDTLPEGIAMTHLDGRIRSTNMTLVKLSGRNQRILEGTPLQEILALPVEALSDGVRDLEAELCDGRGGRLPVIVGSTMLLDNRGLRIGLVVVVHDQRELVSLRSRLLLSGRLAAVGELAAGVAHEINNPLAYVRANVGLLMEHMKEIGAYACEDDARPVRGSNGEHGGRHEDVLSRIDESRELLEETLEGVDRAVSIVRDIRGFSHSGTGEREMVDLCELLDSVLRVAAPQLGVRVAVERDYAALPHVYCAPQEIKQVFLNIVLNASQAIEGDGCIRVEAEASGDFATVRVLDDGPGIPIGVRDRIFDPFFTTKPVGEGTGIGLAISYEIVRRHDGQIELTCPAEGGTCAEVRLPIGTGECAPD